MAIPQPPYSQPGPSYYHNMQPPIPPPYAYGSAHPHNNPPYAFGYPQSPMHGPSPVHHQPNMHRGRGGYHPSRGGGPSFQSFQPAVHHPQQQHYMHPQHPDSYGHSLPHTKYQMPYAPPPLYSPVPIQSGASPAVSASFSPAWSAAEPSPLSPLPKQLSMPPPMSPSQLLTSYPPPSVSYTPQSQQELHSQSHSSPQSPALNSSPDPDRSHVPEPSTQHASQQQTSFIPSPTSSHSASLPSVSSTVPKPTQGTWAVWSRRPQNPSHAPGIIISSHARPPPDVIQNGLQSRTPPPSPPPPLTSLPLPDVSATTQSEEAQKPAMEDQEAQQLKDKPETERELTPPEILSSSATATETTPASSTAPGSPLSTTTSISISARLPVSPLLPKPKEKVEGEDEAVSQAVSLPQDPPELQASSASSPTPVPAPSTASAEQKAVPKPSWAALFHPGASASTSKAANALPTSSVVGFSIPASSLSSPSSTSASAGPGFGVPHKAEIISLLTSGANALMGAAMKIKPRGLVNQGNMCFANAVLQVLVYCPPFHRLFTELGKYMPLPAPSPPPGVDAHVNPNVETPLVEATIRFLREFAVEGESNKEGEAGGKGKERRRDVGDEDGTGDVTDWFVPGYVYDAIKEKKRFEGMRGGHQEDAEEFFGFYLDTLEEELLSLLSFLSPPPPSARTAPKQPVEERLEEEPSQKDEGWMEVGRRNRTVVTRTIKTTESPITRIFGGKFRSALRAPGQRESVLVEDWRSIRLDIQREQIHTINDALDYISDPQPVQLTSSTRPGVTIEANQQVLIETLPPILVLHMKRFLYDTSVGGVVKIGKQIRFGPEVEIGPKLMSPAKKMPTPARYKLFGVLYHHGLSASGGHYTIDVLHPNRDGGLKPREGWIRIDDEYVSDVRQEDVFNGLDRDDRCAYLLLYRRIGWGTQAIRT